MLIPFILFVLLRPISSDVSSSVITRMITWAYNGIQERSYWLRITHRPKTTQLLSTNPGIFNFTR